MFQHILPALLVLLPAAPIPATAPLAIAIQDKAQLRKELDERLAKIEKGDADQLFALALWAQRKGLKPESRRIMRKVIKADPDHEDSRKALGYIRYEDKWVLERDLAKVKKKEEAARKRRQAAEYPKKGYIKHEGTWVKKSDLAYAKLGLSKHEGVWVRKSDKEQLKADKVQHPETGEWIPADDLEKAKDGKHSLDGEWSTVDQADIFHGSWDTPWEILTANVLLRTTMPFAKARQLATEAETALAYARNLLWDPMLPLPERVLIHAYASAEEYREFGATNDATGFSAYGCFFASQHDDQPVAFNAGHKDWSPYYLKHAAGLGTAATLMKKQEVEPTHWLLTGMGSFVERWSNDTSAKHFGRQYLQKGGIRPGSVESFPKRFRIAGDQAPDDLEWNIYQAGIIVSYLTSNPDKRTLGAWEDVREAIKEGKGLVKALRKFERQVGKAEQKIRDHLQKLMTR